MEKVQRSQRMDREYQSLIDWEIHQEIDRRMIELAPIADLVVSLERQRRLNKAVKEINLLGSVFRRALARAIIKRDGPSVTKRAC